MCDVSFMQCEQNETGTLAAIPIEMWYSQIPHYRPGKQVNHCSGGRRVSLLVSTNLNKLSVYHCVVHVQESITRSTLSCVAVIWDWSIIRLLWRGGGATKWEGGGGGGK